MKALVVGYGSIGERHSRLLREAGCDVAVVSSRETVSEYRFDSITEAVAGYSPDYVVVANKTHQHYPALCELAETGFSGLVLVEKPLFDGPRGIPCNSFHSCFTAYNLRFHPVIRKLYYLMKGRKAISVMVHVGQYLPQWRPGNDYRLSYSAHADEGGGVLRDLSHELDYLTWIFGRWQRMVAAGGHFSTLDITSDDIYAIIMSTDMCPVITVQLDYLCRTARRQITVNTDEHTIEADLIGNTLTIDGVVETFCLDRDFTYSSLHMAVISGDKECLCPAYEGMDILRMIDAAEESERRRKWMER